MTAHGRDHRVRRGVSAVKSSEAARTIPRDVGFARTSPPHGLVGSPVQASSLPRWTWSPTSHGATFLSPNLAPSPSRVPARPETLASVPVSPWTNPARNCESCRESAETACTLLSTAPQTAAREPPVVVAALSSAVLILVTRSVHRGLAGQRRYSSRRCPYRALGLH